MASVAFDGSEPRFSPQKGFVALMGFKYNGYIFNSDFNYTRFWLEARQYVKFKSVVFAFRAMGGGIHSGDEHEFVPVEDRFYSGGSTSNRGWQRAALGPLRVSGTPLGGKSVLEMNVEARFPLFWRLDGALFWDQGNVWAQPYTYRMNRLEYSAGAGLRVNTPIGPIRFDVGLPLWSEKRSPQFFLNVGQAF
jgi:outer membrane protein insertion porin family